MDYPEDKDKCDGCAGHKGPVVVVVYFRDPGLLKLCKKCFGRPSLNAGVLVSLRKANAIPVPCGIEEIRAVWRNLGWEVEYAMNAARHEIWKESGETWNAW